jgi:hypothetical protein
VTDVPGTATGSNLLSCRFFDILCQTTKTTQSAQCPNISCQMRSRKLDFWRAATGFVGRSSGLQYFEWRNPDEQGPEKELIPRNYVWNEKDFAREAQ